MHPHLFTKDNVGTSSPSLPSPTSPPTNANTTTDTHQAANKS